jgi:hypothetical protein
MHERFSWRRALECDVLFALWTLAIHVQSEVCMQSAALWPFLSLSAAALVLVPTLASAGHRALAYWLIIPLLVAGMLAAWAHFGVS